MEVGEFELIDRISSSFHTPKGVLGIGDDCAVIPQRQGVDTLVSTDMLVEGSHFLLDDVSPWQLGWKSAAVNISDIAAMGGRPTSTFLSIAIPENLDAGWMEEFIRGYKALSDRFNVPLLGGDTTSSPGGLCINVTVVGEISSGRSRLRSKARPGDLVCVTGTLGDSAAGLQLILRNVERDEDSKWLIDRHYCPIPRVDEGLRLSAMEGVHAMMDISDGVGSDLRHILKASSVGAKIDIEAIPHSPQFLRVCSRNGWDVAGLSVGGGEDYELLFTMADDCKPDIPYTVIGVICPEPGLVWEGGDKDYSGFRHF